MRYRNVIAHFGPESSTLPVMVIGAHYDAFGDTGDLPGADDNASGTAGLREGALSAEFQRRTSQQQEDERSSSQGERDHGND